MDKQHEIISAIKRLTSELGRTPKRDEFTKLSGISKNQVERWFKTYTLALHAAGISEAKPKNFFSSDIVARIDQYKSKPLLTPSIDKKIFCIGDMHAPFVNLNALSMCYAIIEAEKPDYIVQMGDARDQYANARFPRSLNVYTPKQEDELATKILTDFWQTVRRIAPQARCHQILGNHDIRPLKQVMDKAPSLEEEVKESFYRRFAFDGVNFHSDPREPLELEGVLFIHGYLGKLGDHLNFFGKSVVCGHSHRGGAFFRNYGGKTLFELNVGYVGDENSKALGYTPSKVTGWTPGCGIIDAYGPRFIPF